MSVRVGTPSSAALSFGPRGCRDPGDLALIEFVAMRVVTRSALEGRGPKGDGVCVMRKSRRLTLTH